MLFKKGNSFKNVKQKKDCPIHDPLCIFLLSFHFVSYAQLFVSTTPHHLLSLRLLPALFIVLVVRVCYMFV